MNSYNPHARIYADHNATSPLLESIQTAVLELMGEPLANPSANHHLGRLTQQRLIQAQQSVSRLVSCSPESIIWTSSATEANAIALYGHLMASPASHRRIILSAVEHPSVLENAKNLQSLGATVSTLPVNNQGVVELDNLQSLLKHHDDIALVSIMWANNETGAIQPIESISQLCGHYGVRLHVDAVQAVGKLALSFDAFKVDSFSFSGHKLGSLPGCAVLVTQGAALKSWVSGGGQQKGIRGGSAPWHAIIALGYAADIWFKNGESFRNNMKEARNVFEKTIIKTLSDHAIISHDASRIPNTSNVMIQNARGQTLLSALDLAGVAASYGAACATGSLNPSHVLLAMGYSEFAARCAMRFSFGPYDTASTGEALAMRVIECVQRIRHLAPFSK